MRPGALCRVLFDDGIRYLGVVTSSPAIGVCNIEFEDGTSIRAVLPDDDIAESTREDALQEWKHVQTMLASLPSYQETQADPWWCAYSLLHPLERGELGVPVPKNWRRVRILLPKPASESRDLQQEAPAASPSIREEKGATENLSKTAHSCHAVTGDQAMQPRLVAQGITVKVKEGGGGGRGRRGTDSEGNDGIQYRLPPTATKESIRALKDNGCLTPYVCEVGLCVRKCMHAFVRI